MEERRAELGRLRIGALKKEAKAQGVSASALEEAIDAADEPKEAVIGLILAAANASRSRSSDSGSPAVEEGTPPSPSAYHRELEPEPEPEPPYGGGRQAAQSLRGTWSGPSAPPNESLAISSVSSPGLRDSISMDFGDAAAAAGNFAKLRGTLHNAGEMQRVRSHLTSLQGEHDELLSSHQQTLEKLAAEAQLRDELQAAARDAHESCEALLREKAELQQSRTALAAQHAEAIRATGDEHRVAMEQQRAAVDRAASEHREADAAHRAAFETLQQRHDMLVANVATLESDLSTVRTALDAEASRSAASASEVAEFRKARDRDSLTASRLQSELQQTKDELAAANASLSALKSESSAVTQARQDELDRLREQLASQQGALEATQQEVVALTGEKAGLELRAVAHDELVPKFEAVRAELNTSVSQCDALEQSLASKSSACEDLGARVSHAEAEREALGDALTKEKQHVVDLLEHQSAMQAASSEQAAAHSRTEAELAAATTAIAASKSECDAVAQAHQQEIGRLSSQIISLQESLETTRQDVLALSGEKAGLITEKAGLAAQISALKPPNDVASKLEALRSDLHAAEAARNELDRSLRAKSLEAEKLERALEQKLASIADLQSQVASAGSDHASLESESSALLQERQAQVDRLEKQLATSQEALEAMRHEVLELSKVISSLSVRADAHDQMSQKLEAAQSELTTSVAACNELEKNLAEKSALIEALEAAQEAKIATFVELESELAAASASIASMKSESSALAEARKEEIGRLSAQVDSQRNALDAAQQELVTVSTAKAGLEKQCQGYEQLSEKFEATQADLNASVSACNVLEQSLAAKSEAWTDLEASHLAKIAEIAELERKLSATNASLTALKSQSSAVTQARQDELDRLSTQLSMHQSALDSAQQEVVRLTNEKAELSARAAAHDELVPKFEAVQAELITSIATCNQLEEALTTNSTVMTKLEATHESTVSSHALLESRLSTLSAELAALTAGSDTSKQALQQDVDRLNSELSTSKEALQATRDEILNLSSAKSRLAVKGEAYDEMATRLETVQAELTETSLFHRNAEEALASATAACSSLQAELTATKSARDSLAQEQAHHKQMVIDLDSKKDSLLQEIAALKLQNAQQRLELSQRSEALTQVEAAQQSNVASISELESELAATHAAMEAMKSESAAAIQTRRDEIDRLSAQLASAQAALKEAHQATVTLSSDNGRLQTRTASYDDLAGRFEATQADLNASVSACNVLEQSLAAKSEAWTDLEASHLAKIAEIAELERKLSATNASLTALKSQSSAVTQARQDELDRLSTQLSMHQSALDSAQQEVVRLTNEKAELSARAAAHDELVPKFEAVQAELTETSLSHRNAKEALASATATCSSLQAELTATKLARDSLAQEQAHHKQMVIDLGSKKDSLLQEIAALSQQHAHTQAELSQESAAHAQAKAAQHSSVASISELESELAAANGSLSALKSESSAVTQARQDELDRLREQLASQQGALEATQQEVVALTGEKAGLELRAVAHDELVPKFEAVQAELNTSVGMCNELETTLSSQTSSLSELKAEHEAKIASNVEIQSKLAAANASLSTLESQSSAMAQARQDEINRLDEQLKAEREALSNTRQEVLTLSSSMAAMAVRAAAHDDVASRLQTVQAELTETSLSHRNAKEAASIAQEECSSLQAELTATKSARDSLAQEQAHHKQMVIDLGSKKDSLLQEIAALSQQHAHTQAELSQESAAHAQAKAAQHSSVASISELESELAAANGSLSALKSESSAVTQARQDELDRLQEQLASQQGALEATQQEVVALTGEKAGLELRAVAHDELVPKFEAVQAELNTSVSQCNELETTLSSQTSSLSELKAEHEAKIESVADLHSELASSASSIASLKSQNTTAERAHEEELQRLSAQLASEQQAREAARKEMLALSSEKAGLATEKAGLAARANEAHKVLSELKDGHSALAAKHEKILSEKRAAHKDAMAQKQSEVDELKGELKITVASRTELLGALSTVQESLRESQAASAAQAKAQTELQARYDAEQARTAALESELAATRSEITQAADEQDTVASVRQEEIDRLVGQLSSMQTSLDRRQEVVHLLSQQVEYLLTMVPNAGDADGKGSPPDIDALVASSMTAQQRSTGGGSSVASPSQFGATSARLSGT